MLWGDAKSGDLWETEDAGEDGVMMGSSFSFMFCQYSSPYERMKDAESAAEEQCSCPQLQGMSNSELFSLEGYKLMTPAGREKDALRFFLGRGELKLNAGDIDAIAGDGVTWVNV